MPSEKKLLKKIEKYEKRLHRLHHKRRSRSTSKISRSRSRSLLRSPELLALSDPQPVAPDGDNIEEDEPIVTQPESEENSTQGDISMAAAFQEALGDEYEDNAKFVGDIKTEISKRWKHILENGLAKDEKDSILKKYKLPVNCQLLEAPTLNEEVKSALTESSKIRDRSLEMVQHQLGIATAVIGQVMTNLIDDKDVDKIMLITKLADASKLLNDIHFQKTRTRRILISPVLDKSFNNLIEKVKRDEHLYGMDLGTKIKTSQELKKSTYQIKKAVPRPAPKPAPKPKPVGNRYGPPQTPSSQQTKTTAIRGGPRNRVPPPPPRRQNYQYPRPERAAPRGSHNRR